MIVSSIVCKFYFVSSEELSEDGSFDGWFVVEASHGALAVAVAAALELLLQQPLQGHFNQPDDQAVDLLIDPFPEDFLVWR